MGILQFYGITDIPQIIDEILIMPFPDEDLVSTLLLEYHLKDLANTSLIPTSSLESCLQTVCQLREKQRRFLAGTWINSDLMPPPSIPPSLKEYLEQMVCPLPPPPPSRHQFLEHPQFDWRESFFFSSWCQCTYVLVLTFFFQLPMNILYLLRIMSAHFHSFCIIILVDD